MDKRYEEFYEYQLDAYVKIKADFHCERCGRRNEAAFWYAQLRPFINPRSLHLKLAVHHLDGNPENNRLANLICLCQKCHLFAERQNRRFKQVSLLRWLTNKET